MSVFLLIVVCLVFLSLIMVTSVIPSRSLLSMYELERRAEDGDKTAKAQLERERLLGDIQSILRIKTALLLVIFVILSVVTFDWPIGITLAVVVALVFGMISKLKVVYLPSQKIYELIEPRLLTLVRKFPRIMKLIRTPGSSLVAGAGKIDSRQELQYLIDNSADVLTENERKLIISGLSFNEMTVGSVMTPKSVIDSIKKSEFLGPLTLDDLHKTGHSRLPVIDKDIDHVVGILHLRSLLALDIKRSTTAEKAMDPKVYYVREDQTLSHALAAFLRTHHHLFIVVNEYRETVGLLTLEDVIEVLIGHKIIDEFDTHDDLRAVAMRNPGGNNEPQKSQNV